MYRRSRGRQIASRMIAAKTWRRSDAPPGPTASKIVAPKRGAELDRQRGGDDERDRRDRVEPRDPAPAGRVVYGFSRCPVRNSHALQATTAAASAAVTASDSATLTSLVPRKP